MVRIVVARARLRNRLPWIRAVVFCLDRTTCADGVSPSCAATHAGDPHSSPLDAGECESVSSTTTYIVKLGRAARERRYKGVRQLSDLSPRFHSLAQAAPRGRRQRVGGKEVTNMMSNGSASQFSVTLGMRSGR